MKTLLTFLAFLLVSQSFAQRAELKQLCGKLEETLTGSSNLHLQYKLTITDRNDLTNQQSMVMHMYKANGNQKMVMGETQEIIQDGLAFFMVNHLQKTMVVQKDTTSIKRDNAMLSDLSELIDSAATVTKVEKNGTVTYTMRYPDRFMYTMVIMSFNGKNKQIVNLYADFSPQYPEPYHSLNVDYQVWDLKWKPDAGFPNLDKYLSKTTKGYQPKVAWQEYQFFQPQQGTLKF